MCFNAFYTLLIVFVIQQTEMFMTCSSLRGTFKIYHTFNFFLSYNMIKFSEDSVNVSMDFLYPINVYDAWNRMLGVQPYECQAANPSIPGNSSDSAMSGSE